MLRAIPIKKSYYICIILFLSVASQPAKGKDKVEPFAFKINLPNPIIVNNIEVEGLPDIEVITEERDVMEPLINVFNTRNKAPTDDKKSISPLLKKQVCRDNVDVTYRIIDENAVSGIYQAKVQAQGVVLSVTEDDLKIKSTGWFTQNPNLQKWQPYLTKPPLAKDILLKVGSNFWDNRKKWYKCNT